MHYILLLFIFFLTPPFVFSQEIPPNELIITNTILNENDFLNLYLDNSFSTKAIPYNLAAADQKVNIALQPYMGSFFMDVQSFLGTTTNFIPIQNIGTNGQPLSKDMKIDYTNMEANLGLDATVYPSGTYLKIQGGVRNYNIRSYILDMTNNGPITDINSQEYRDKYLHPFFNITLVQPWLKNGFAYNMHSRVIAIASNNTQIEYLQEKIKLEETVLQALIQYHKLILQTKAIAILEQSLSNLQNMYKTQNRLRRAGARAEFDIMQLQVKLNELENALALQKNDLELTFQTLEERLNFPLNRTNLNFLDYSELQDKIYSELSVYKNSLEHSKDLKKLTLLLNNVRDSIQIIKNQALPELNTILSYEVSKSSYRDHPFLNQDAAIFNVPQDSFYVGLQFKMPLVNITDKAKIKEIYSQSNSLEFNKIFLEKELALVSKEKYSEWHNANLKVQLQSDNLTLNNNIAIEALRRYRNSEMSIADFFDYEESFRQNQIQLAQEEFKKKISALTIEVVQGTLLDTYKIDVINTK
ncbi:MAG: TolC family protein [Brevinemataceae bacterium]